MIARLPLRKWWLAGRRYFSNFDNQVDIWTYGLALMVGVIFLNYSLFGQQPIFCHAYIISYTIGYIIVVVNHWTSNNKKSPPDDPRPPAPDKPIRQLPASLPSYEVECGVPGCDWANAYDTHLGAINALTAHKRKHARDNTTRPTDNGSTEKYPPNPFTNPESGYVYLLREQSKGHYKIGYTKNPANRYETFELKLPFYSEYAHVIPCQNMKQAEAYLHAQFAGRRIKGTEWFALTPTDVKFFKNLGPLDLRGAA